MKAGRAVLLLGTALQAFFVSSLFTHQLDPLFLEATGSFGQAGDYFGIYQASDNLAQGRGIYSREGRPPGDPRRVPYFYFYRYLPPTACLMAGLSLLLPPWPAYWLWITVTELLFLLFVRSLLRSPLGSRATREAMAGIALGFSPFYLEQWMGQFSFLMALLLWGTFVPELPRRDAPVSGHGPGGSAARGGFWSWSASVALKSFSALFAIPYLRQGRWRRVLLAAAVVVLACLPYFLARPQDVAAFVSANFGPLPAAVHGGSYGLSSWVRALIWLVAPAFAGHRFVLGSRDAFGATLFVYAASALVLAVSLCATWRMGRRGAAAEALALWTLTFFLFYKDVWEYHYVMLLPVVALLALRGPARLPLLLGAWLALPTPWVFYHHSYGALPVARWPAGLVLLHYGWKVLPVIGLYALSLARTARTADAGARAVPLPVASGPIPAPAGGRNRP